MVDRGLPSEQCLGVPDLGLTLLRIVARQRCVAYPRTSVDLVQDHSRIAVAHREFKAIGPATVRALCRRNHVLFDVKYMFPAQDVDGRL